jgi:succinate dehydrogenase / fumarate reductase cytochrome b subunit
MEWVVKTVTSSIGKKTLMALTGLGFLGFLAGHLAGNLTVFMGKGAFTAYAVGLHQMEAFIKLAETGLLVLAAIHITTGLLLFAQNFMARPVRYKVKRNAGGRTWSSATMPYTGIYLILFVSLHLLAFTFTPHAPEETFALVAGVFGNPLYAAFYMVSMLVVALHVRHGLWSAFQTLGANHPKYMPGIEKISLAFAVVVAIGFGSLPLAFLLAA